MEIALYTWAVKNRAVVSFNDPRSVRKSNKLPTDTNGITMYTQLESTTTYSSFTTNGNVPMATMIFCSISTLRRRSVIVCSLIIFTVFVWFVGLCTAKIKCPKLPVHNVSKYVKSDTDAMFTINSVVFLYLLCIRYNNIHPMTSKNAF